MSVEKKNYNSFHIELSLSQPPPRDFSTMPAQLHLSTEVITAILEAVNVYTVLALLCDPMRVLKDWTPKRRITYDPNNKMTIDEYDDEWCLEFLRFTKSQIKEIAFVLQIPSKFRYGIVYSPLVVPRFSSSSSSCSRRPAEPRIFHQLAKPISYSR